ncbi:MAG: 3-deoxy-D-manno-octulosonic acid transferase [Desulforhopalus sp.]
MFVLYNILHLVFLPVFLPFIILFVLFTPKYRDRFPARLGIGLGQQIPMPLQSGQTSVPKTIWLHALSVGEVTSTVPLITGLRKSYPDSRIIVSVTTRTGKRTAENLLSSLADHIIDGPFDLLPVVSRFMHYIQPDLFILVETDFWPNTLLYLNKNKIPTILVNGRVSQKSMEGYQRLRFFFYPMFQSFSFLCMQTKRDRDKMEKMGLPGEKLKTLGNLKFDTFTAEQPPSLPTSADLLPGNRLLLICGSTHPGEEKILIESYCQVRKKHPEIFMIIAPRDTKRSVEIQVLAAAHGLTVALRSDKSSASADIFILDTIGELVHFYSLSDIGFVGGSLVNKGGHNPIEPATFGIPVIFGPNMQDFSEIADALIATGGATVVSDHQQLSEIVTLLLESPELRTQQGHAAQQYVARQRGVIDKHLELIGPLL